MLNIFCKILFSIIFLIIPQEYQLRDDGIPTTSGIELYVKNEQDKILEEYQKFIQDTIYDVYIYTDNLSKLEDYNELELGRYYLPKGSGHQIVIDNQEKFLSYELKTLSSDIRKTLIESNKFVKATIFHELTHAYFFQNILEMNIKNININSAYNNIRIYPSQQRDFGVEFIEEGICEYISEKHGEIIPYQYMYIPRNEKQLLNKNNLYNVKYKYASYFVKKFLDTSILKYGRVKYGIQILLANTPPTYEEILKPDLFFNRLDIKNNL